MFLVTPAAMPLLLLLLSPLLGQLNLAFVFMCLLVPSVVPYFTIISAEAMRTWDRTRVGLGQLMHWEKNILKYLR